MIKKILKMKPNTKVVCKKIGAHAGEFRVQRVIVIGGENRTETLYRENGVKMRFGILLYLFLTIINSTYHSLQLCSFNLLPFILLFLFLFLFLLCPLPSSLFPLPSSLFPLPSSLFPLPSSLFPLPSSLFPLPVVLSRLLNCK
jgi:hypothetical protein